MAKDEKNQEQLDEQTTQEIEQEAQADISEQNDEEKFASLDEEFKAKMEEKVAIAEQKAKEAEEKYLRTHADFENIKKRLEKEKYQAIDYASEKFAKDLLTTIDTLEAALGSFDNQDVDPKELLEKVKEGVEHTLKKLKDTFEKHDISEVEYDEFNPEYHNAIQQVPSDEHDKDQIVQVFQKGYKFKERLLRPAMVSLAT